MEHTDMNDVERPDIPAMPMGQSRYISAMMLKEKNRSMIIRRPVAGVHICMVIFFSLFALFPPRPSGKVTWYVDARPMMILFIVYSLYDIWYSLSCRKIIADLERKKIIVRSGILSLRQKKTIFSLDQVAGLQLSRISDKLKSRPTRLEVNLVLNIPARERVGLFVTDDVPIKHDMVRQFAKFIEKPLIE